MHETTGIHHLVLVPSLSSSSERNHGPGDFANTTPLRTPLLTFDHTSRGTVRYRYRAMNSSESHHGRSISKRKLEPKIHWLLGRIVVGRHPENNANNIFFFLRHGDPGELGIIPDKRFVWGLFPLTGGHPDRLRRHLTKYRT